jgi:hypothetical protein
MKNAIQILIYNKETKSDTFFTFFFIILFIFITVLSPSIL